MLKDIITNETSEDSLDKRTVCVTGLKESDAELCLLYFENRRSEGGKLEEDGVVWDEEAEHFVITFVDSHDAARVIQKKDHNIAGKRVEVRPLPTTCSYEDMVLITGIPAETSSDDLASFLENMGVAVDSVQLNETDNKALIILSNTTTDLEHLQLACQMNPLEDGSILSVQSVPLTHTVLVNNLNPITTDSAILYFFSNESSYSGGPAFEITRLDSTSALVHFEDHLDTQAVIDKDSHVLDDFPLDVSLHLECFSPASKDPFVIRNKIIEVEGQVPSSAYKDTVNGGPLLDRRQKFLEQVVDTMLETPTLSTAISKALGIFGNGTLNSKPVARNKHYAAGNFCLEVTIQVAFTSPSSSLREGENGKLRTNGCLTSANAGTSPQASLGYRQDCRKRQQQPSHCVSTAASQGYHSNNGDSFWKRSGFVLPKPQSQEQEFQEDRNKKSHNKLAHGPYSSGGLQKAHPTVQSSGNYTEALSSCKTMKRPSAAACSYKPTALDQRQPTESATYGTEMYAPVQNRKTIIRLGGEVVARLRQDKEELRSLASDLSKIQGRFNWKLPNHIVVTAITSVPHDWEQQVARLMERKRRQPYV